MKLTVRPLVAVALSGRVLAAESVAVMAGKPMVWLCGVMKMSCETVAAAL